MKIDHKLTQHGFTLIELSIVLVIIGLIVGGILVGRDLIAAASTRAQLGQIEKLNTAIRTFQTKYNCLPGDCNASQASQFAFIARGSNPGQGDGNGLIQGTSSNNACDYCASGETLLFWTDLTQANLYPGSFSAASGTVCPAGHADYTQLVPTASIGNNNFLYVFANNNANWFGVSAVNSMLGNCTMASNLGLTVGQSYNMDSKVDDGLPSSGNVQAIYVQNAVQLSPYTPWPPQSSQATSCERYDPTGTFVYSTDLNVNLSNCGLSFKFR